MRINSAKLHPASPLDERPLPILDVQSIRIVACRRTNCSQEIRGCGRCDECGVEATQSVRKESQGMAERRVISRRKGMSLRGSNLKKSFAILHGSAMDLNKRPIGLKGG